MIEIRFHGRGGQGAVVGSKILATAMFSEGRFVQAFPFFGIERRGAPVTAFVRCDDKKIYLRNQIRHPDHLIVLDPTLLANPATFEGFRREGWVLVNHRLRPHDMGEMEVLRGLKVATVDASAIAVGLRLGSRLSPIVNTAILGAFARVTGLVTLESVVRTIEDEVPIEPQANAQAARQAFDEVRFPSEEPNPEIEQIEAAQAKAKA